MMKLITILLMSFFTADVFAAGKVTQIKGRVLFLPESGHRKYVELNQIIEGDGTLATSEKSFVKLQFEDGATISLGPNSQTNIGQKIPDKPKVIELIKGQLRASADEKKPLPPEGHKLYIKTRTASMGVRGTDFMVVHNPKNHVTATVTFKGNVQIYKKKDEEIHESLREDFDNKAMAQKNHQIKSMQNISDDLHHHTVESVTPGTLSGAYPSYEKAQAPITLSPVQWKALAGNEQMNSGPSAPVIKGQKFAQASTPKNSDLLPTPPGDRPVPTANDKQDSKSAEGIRSGGVLDLNSGLYLAPPEGSIFDKKSGTYILPEEYGGINSETGEYVPPPGIKLDPLYGFVAMGPESKDRKVVENFKKLKNLTGNFNQRLSKTLGIFKEISRVDVFGYANYRFTTNAMENYYGEWRALSNSPTMILDWKIHTGTQLYHSQDWLIYPKFHFYTIYHERDIAEIKRNDMMEMMLGWETHRKHTLFGKKARLVADLQFRTVYMDYKKRQQYDYYTEDTGIKVSERFQFNRFHLSEGYYQIRAFQGYQAADHGNIHNLGFTHRFFLGKYIDLQLNAEHSVRKEQWSTNRYKIDRLKGEVIFLNLLRQTDLTAGYTWEWHYYQYQPATLLHDQGHPYRLNENMKSGFYYRANWALQKRLGNFWKANGLYEYSRQRTGASGNNKAFIGQTWGAGLTMVF